MPISLYRVRKHRYRIQPKKFVWTRAAITYDKTGSLTASALVSGADVFEAAETGSLTATALMSGVSQAIFATRSFPPRYPYPVVRRRTRARML